MRPQKIDDKKLLNSLVKVFRAKGYDGASLKELADASGLQKASLYHRFPGGKKDMALTVLSYLGKWVEEHIFQTLYDPTLTLSTRLTKALENISFFYSNGDVACILRALSIGSGLDLFGAELKTSMQKWIDTFKQFGIACGLDEETAYNHAFKVLTMIQGSLIVSRGLGSNEPFEKALQGINSLYKQAPNFQAL